MINTSLLYRTILIFTYLNLVLSRIDTFTNSKQKLPLYNSINIYDTFNFQTPQIKIVAANNYIQMEISLTQSLQKVTVFLRSYKKYAFPLIVDPLITNKSLKQLITQRVSHIIKNLAIFLKGKLIDDSQNVLNLLNNSIVHIVDVDRTQTPEINLIFRLHKQPQKLITIKTQPTTIIREMMQYDLKPIIGKGQNQVFLVYVGKPLNIFKKLEEEYVEDEAQMMVVQFKVRLNIEPKPKQHVEQIKHTRVIRVASIASTKKNFAPAIGTANQYTLSKFKTNITKKLQSKIIQAGAKEESASPTLKQKKEENQMKLEPIAPGCQQLTKYEYFDPLKQTAPGAEVKGKMKVIPHDPNFKQIKEIKEETAPASQSLLFKEEDFIFAGDAKLEQTEAVMPGTIQEVKQTFTQHKKSSKEFS